jgi:hypothetical protein
MFASAIEGTKRKAEAPPDAHNKRRLPDRPLGAPGPRMQDRMNGRERGMAPGGPGGPGGRSLSDRLGMGPGPGPRGAQAGRELLGRPGRDVRGPNGPMGNQPFRPHNVQQNQQQFMPGQQEMMMQMMAMQANMMQMAEQMKQMQNPQVSKRDSSQDVFW